MHNQPWRPIDPVPEVNGTLTPLLSTVDSLQAAWKEALLLSTPDEQAAASARRLRRHAVETGIIERLYDLDWGVTETLVAEGLTAEAANRAGGISEDTLETIRSQYEALEYVMMLERRNEDLSVRVIRELHALITRNQHTYEARDQFGRMFDRPLRHGEWKQQPNHVRRPDGTLLEYAPPEHVQSEIEQLITFYRQSAMAHPVVRAAWLHHRFIQIHPFEDGNGRVARALTLLELLRDRYAPLVVDRRERDDYIRALDKANGGDIADLVRLFARLEIVAMQTTLSQPTRYERQAHSPHAVLQTRAHRLRDLRAIGAPIKREAVQRLAAAVHAGVTGYLDGEAVKSRDPLLEIDPAARVRIDHAAPPDERSHLYRDQIRAAADAIGFHSNLSDGAWWTSVEMDALGERLRYVAVTQKVGQGETGVLALTACADLIGQDSDKTAGTRSALDLNPTDSVALAYTDEFANRHAEIEDFLRDTFRRALERFAEQLG